MNLLRARSCSLHFRTSPFFVSPGFSVIKRPPGTTAEQTTLCSTTVILLGGGVLNTVDLIRVGIRAR